jgi:DNA-binding XRE family transcriptional regulator
LKHIIINKKYGLFGSQPGKKNKRESLISKSELARKAGISPLTIDRVEKGKNCRMETKRKIISALGYKLSDKDKIFPGNSSA